MDVMDWAVGDLLGLRIPAHSEALRAGGVAFLTAAFQATGALSADNRVKQITQFEECPGGSTGRKLLLSVEYERPAPGLHTNLFVKFSRDFDDALRDRARIQMELEVRFALLSRIPEFPIAVPVCYCADYHHGSGTGILITERVPFGKGSIERHYPKCMDHLLPNPLEHYQALVTALARLAGTDKAGRLGNVAAQFPFEPEKLAVSERPPYTAKQLQNRIARYADFAAEFPQLLPANIRSPAFTTKLSQDVARFPEHMPAINRFLGSKPAFVALCHWNANIDNAWFWQASEGRLRCGLLDWGHVSQMNLAMALWGSLSGARTELWDDHLDALLALFIQEFQGCGGPPLDAWELKLHLELYVAMMGLTWLLDTPPLIKQRIPDLAQAKGPLDECILADELSRSQLQMMTNFLNFWERQDFGRALDQFLLRAQS